MDRKSSLARGYSHSAAEYDATAGRMYLAGLWRLIPQLRKVRRPAVLDVGTGTGINLLELNRLVGPCRLLVGIDLSPGMVAVARAKAALAGVPAQFHVGDAEALPYPDQTFDIVVCNSVLHWVQDRPRAIREFARVLRPGGQLLLACAAQPGFGEWFGVVQSAMALLFGSQTGPVPVLPSAAEVAAALTAAGLVPVHFNHLVQSIRVPDPLSFARMMACVAPFWSGDLTPEQRERVTHTCGLLMRLVAPSGFRCTWAAVELVARKANGPPFSVV